MKKFMMHKMMPMMSGTIRKMEFSEKEKMMDKMMPHMMSNLTFEEKMKMMQKMMPLMMEDLTMENKMTMMQIMMPLMMKDIEMSQMDNMMDTMMPTMMNQMLEKGINMFDMMRMMCPKCVSLATSQASDEDKQKLKSDMTEIFSKI
jgi:hypothetical protein